MKIYPSATSPAGKLIPLPPGMVPLLAPAPGSPFQFSGAQPSRADARIIRMDRSERRACARTADSLTTNARAKGNVSGARAAWEDEHAREPGGSGHLDMALPVCRFESCSPESAISDYAGSNPAPSTPSLSIKPRSIGCACSKRDIGRGSACSRNVSRARGMTLSAGAQKCARRRACSGETAVSLKGVAGTAIALHHSVDPFGDSPTDGTKPEASTHPFQEWRK